jgi:hypothetical protein
MMSRTPKFKVELNHWLNLKNTDTEYLYVDITEIETGKHQRFTKLVPTGPVGPYGMFAEALTLAITGQNSTSVPILAAFDEIVAEANEVFGEFTLLDLSDGIVQMVRMFKVGKAIEFNDDGTLVDEKRMRDIYGAKCINCDRSEFDHEYYANLDCTEFRGEGEE